MLTLGLSVGAFAQKEVEKVKTYLKANAAQYHLSNKDIDEMDISSAYLSPSTGWYHVYFVQKYQAIEVYNGILNTILVNENVANVANTFVTDIASKIPAKITLIPVSPTDAISKAATSLKLPGNDANTQQVSVNRLPNGQIEKAVYTNADLSKDNINVKLYWFPYDTLVGQQMVSKINLVWNVQIYTKDHKNNWSVQVDALTGDIIDTKDMVIHCDFGTPEHKHDYGPIISHEPTSQTRESFGISQPFAANSYKVFDYPLESPSHGSQTVVISPYTRFLPAGKGPGATNGWHHDSVSTYTTTRGNNVFAKEDRDDNDTGGYSPTSATLDFNYDYNNGVGTANANLDAAITNLFYWNNVVHDVLYRYGFDEPSGNFQRTNKTGLGLGNDFVNADAQDGSGTDNANFYTPIDGFNPRMQMYLWTAGGTPAYEPDSDFDNGVIAHEYGHGWSTRLTGGAANSSCLNNSEQGGEGWSDFLALMLTTDWSKLTPTFASAIIPRGIGTYSLAKQTNGTGIRNYRYSYDMANINSVVTYGKVGDTKFAIPHGIGSIWATMLWDMTWEIIMQDGQIANNIYTVPTNIADMRGNIAALKLVNEGLRLQPCSPSFVQARDAILTADSLLFNKRYKCAIWKAFARRGLGRFASTGASTNDRIVTEDFTPFADRVLTSVKTATICSGSAFTYTATSSASGTTFAWSRLAVPGISNAAGSGNSATINETLINTTTEPIIVVYYFTLTPSNCPVKQEVWVTVNPAPVASVGTYLVCKDSSVPSGQGLAVSSTYTYNLSGTIVSGSTYNRAKGDSATTYVASGTNVYYQATSFVSPITGRVVIETIDGSLTGCCRFDTYVSLYQNSFTPATPATNFLIGDDDRADKIYGSKIGYNLTAGTTYYVVVATYGAGTTGGYTLRASVPVFPLTNNWFTASSGGASIFSGNVFNPVGVAGSGVPNTATPGSTNFYVENSKYPGCRTKTTFIINPPSVGGTIAGSTTVCAPTNAGTLTLSGHTGSIVRWESSTDNFASNIVSITNTTTTLNFSNLTQTTRYRAVVKNGSCAQVYSAVATITVNTASPPTPVGNSRCGTGTVTLTASGCAGGTINWYAGASGGASLGTGTSFTTPSISSTTPYFAACTVGSCTSSRVSATATVNAIPGAPTPSGASRCGPGTVTLTATGCAGGSISWYTVTTGGTSVGTGGTYTTPSISNTTTYYVSCTVNGCSSARVPVQATININLTMSGAQVAGNYRASQSITSTANVATGVNYYAGKSILLNPGFQAGASETFKAEIANCP
ncbi:hypothetical protein GCM10027442_25000 [Emticicia fontis]